MKLQTRLHPATIQTFSHESAGPTLIVIGGGTWNTLADSAWAAANRALFVPFVVAQPLEVTRIGVYNGNPVNGNFDIGIYTEDGVRLVSSGATVQAGGLAVQQVALSTFLGIGRFYMALAHDDNVGHYSVSYCPAAANNPGCAGVAQMEAAYPLPANAVLAACANNQVPVISVLMAPRTVF